ALRGDQAMSLAKMDHVALEVGDIDYYIDQLVGTGGMKLLRRATALRSGTRMAMVGDPTGMKIELIENRDAPMGPPKFMHVTCSSGDAEATGKGLVDKGWTWERGPIDLKEAQARSVLVSDGQGFEMQLLTYQSTSPDIVEWPAEESK